jgi:hypothetical protein
MFWMTNLIIVGNTGRPLSSNHPIPELPATSFFPVSEMPESHLVKDVLDFIGAREDIHPSRLYFTSLIGNEKRRSATTVHQWHGIAKVPMTSKVPNSPDADTAVIITVYLSNPSRREDARTIAPIAVRFVRAQLHVKARLEQSKTYRTFDGIAGAIAVGCCWCTANTVAVAAMNDDRVVSSIFHMPLSGR